MRRVRAGLKRTRKRLVVLIFCKSAAIHEQFPNECRASFLAAKMVAVIRWADANLWLLNSSNFFDFSIDGMRQLRRFAVSNCTSFDLMPSA